MEDKKVDLQDENLEDIKEEETKETKKEKKLKPKEQIELLAQENYELREMYLKSQAELENFKKRMNEERIKDRKYAATNLIDSLLLPLDQLKKVVEMKTEDEVLKNFLIGFKMINDQIYQVLENDGLKEIDALGKEFDPHFHHAVEKDNNEEFEDGVITEVTQIGYMYKDRILRPAMVKVNEINKGSDENEKDE